MKINSGFFIFSEEEMNHIFLEELGKTSDVVSCRCQFRIIPFPPLVVISNLAKNLWSERKERKKTLLQKIYHRITPSYDKKTEEYVSKKIEEFCETKYTVSLFEDLRLQQERTFTEEEMAQIIKTYLVFNGETVLKGKSFFTFFGQSLNEHIPFAEFKIFEE